jgi:2-dehydro-3-deoxyphosphogluconate aldolase/(4S)-4-hydroxy-2-oxoglutarate aldolase
LETTIERLGNLGAVGVIRGETAADAVEVSDALIAGGMKAIEITFTTPNAGNALSELRARHGEGIMLGAGTITEPSHVEEARFQGAEFLVSPGSVSELVERMIESGLAAIPGALTPTEVQRALGLDVPAVKIFPGSLGGSDYLKALRGPFPETRFIPTGGVSEQNLGEWFSAGAYAVGVGGALAPGRLESEGQRAELVAGAGRLVEKVSKVRSGG